MWGDTYAGDGDAESDAAVAAAVGGVIMWTKLAVSYHGESEPTCLVIRLTDGRVLRVSDDGQDCCERRFVTCDDDLPGFAGARISAIEVRRSTGDIAFVHVITDKGTIVLTTHNENNGYYDGFVLTCRFVTEPSLKLASPIVVPVNAGLAEQASKFTIDDQGNAVRKGEAK